MKVPSPFDVFTYFVSLLAIAILYNIHMFILNDYADVEIDRLGKYLSEKPLVKGTVSKKGALAFAGIALLTAFLLACLITKGGLIQLTIFSLSVILSGVYNFLGKRFAGGDLILASATSTLSLFSALSVSPTITLANLHPLIYVICLLNFIQVLYNDSVHGGVKDADHDHLSGAITLAGFLGVKVEDHNLKMPTRFVAYGLTVKIVYLALLIYAFITFNLNTLYMDIPIFLLMVPFIFGMLLATARYLSLDTWDREKLWNLFRINEYCTFSLIPIMSLSIINLWGVLLLMSIPQVLPFTIRLLVFGRGNLIKGIKYH